MKSAIRKSPGVLLTLALLLSGFTGLAVPAPAVKSQRRAERQEYLKHLPCSLCGRHHTGSLPENFIGVIHGIIWILRSFALIAA